MPQKAIERSNTTTGRALQDAAVIDGGAADIHPHGVCPDRNEILLPAGLRIGQADRHHVSLPKPCGSALSGGCSIRRGMTKRPRDRSQRVMQQMRCCAMSSWGDTYITAPCPPRRIRAGGSQQPGHPVVRRRPWRPGAPREWRGSRLQDGRGHGACDHRPGGWRPSDQDRAPALSI